MKICYIEKRFFNKSWLIIEKANEIIKEYAEQGFSLTLRQLYYQFVARGFIENKQSEYNRVGSIINDGRLAGHIDWLAIVDRTRFVRDLSHWESPAEIIREDAECYRIDKWKHQDYRPIVWIEKDALIGIIEGICQENDIPYFACRGYVSQSALWSAAQKAIKNSYRQIPMIIHLGDHDPSGIDMTRDIEDRFKLFGVDKIKVVRIALNMDQIEKFNPPPNPAKLTDTRARGYIEKFGDESWELDALDPPYIAEIIQHEIFGIRDVDIWAEDVEEENEAKRRLRELADNWEI